MPMSENETSTIISFFLPEVWDQKYFPVSPLSSLKTKFTTQTPLTLRIPGKHLIMYQLGKRKRTCYQMMEISWRPSLTATDYKENKKKCESCFRILNKNITITQSEYLFLQLCNSLSSLPRLLSDASFPGKVDWAYGHFTLLKFREASNPFKVIFYEDFVHFLCFLAFGDLKIGMFIF